MLLIFLAMSACATAGDERASLDPVPVLVTLDYPEECEPTEGYPHRYLVTREGRSGKPIPLPDPTAPFTVSAHPGSVLTVMTAVCDTDDEACCPVTVDYVFAPSAELTPEIAVEIPDPRRGG